MSANIQKMPKAAVLNPILLMLFKMGWEEPADQLTTVLATHQMADQIEDKAVRAQIRTITGKQLAKLAQNTK